jgi:hypothetical protein
MECPAFITHGLTISESATYPAGKARPGIMPEWNHLHNFIMIEGDGNE